MLRFSEQGYAWFCLPWESDSSIFFPSCIFLNLYYKTMNTGSIWLTLFSFICFSTLVVAANLSYYNCRSLTDTKGGEFARMNLMKKLISGIKTEVMLHWRYIAKVYSMCRCTSKIPDSGLEALMGSLPLTHIDVLVTVYHQITFQHLYILYAQSQGAMLLQLPCRHVPSAFYLNYRFSMLSCWRHFEDACLLKP